MEKKANKRKKYPLKNLFECLDIKDLSVRDMEKVLLKKREKTVKKLKEIVDLGGYRSDYEPDARPEGFNNRPEGDGPFSGMLERQAWDFAIRPEFSVFNHHHIIFPK